MASFVASLLSVVMACFGGFSGVPQLKWNGDSDKAVKVDIVAVQNTTRKNASGDKITSNSHSKDFPGIYFIWDSKQKDSGYLKVEDWMFNGVEGTNFGGFEYFTLTSKESSTYWDFKIALQPGQKETADNCFVFYIPKVYNNKNINMVFFDENGYALNPTPDPIPVYTDDQIAYLRYRAYVKLWNDLRSPYVAYDANNVAYLTETNYVTQTLSDEGGMAHYQALLAFYNQGYLPPYFAFADYLTSENWADRLEQGLVDVLEYNNGWDAAQTAAFLTQTVKDFGDTVPADFFN